MRGQAFRDRKGDKTDRNDLFLSDNASLSLGNFPSFGQHVWLWVFLRSP